MKEEKIKFIKICSVCICIVMALTSVVSAAGAIVSPGLDIIASRGEMAKSGLMYSDINFAGEDFEKALGISKISSITVRTLPDASEGTLKLGSEAVSLNQTISRSSIKNMRFVPASSEVTQSDFSFSYDGGDYTTVCNLYILPKVNFAPVTKISPTASLSIQTQKGISFFGTLNATDPENDALVYEIVREPKKGTLTLTDKTTGDYKYTPNESYTGKDSFSYTVRDKYGNYSDITNVKIQVRKADSSVFFTDMKDHWAHNAAITVSASGIMEGKVVGGESYFFPDKKVTRCEFLAMAMRAVGIDNVKTCDATIFTDDDDIPSEYKGYVATALGLGYVHGDYTSCGIFFGPNEEITRAEAAVMINNMIEAKEPSVLPTFADMSTVPAWSQSAFYALNAIGVFNGTGGGNLSPYQTINRAQAAQIFASLLNNVK